MKILYISYDGLMEPLGNSQVLQYLKKLAPEWEIFLLTYEKADEWKDLGRRERLIAEARGAGIRWMPLRYHKRPSALATSYDLARGLALSLYLVRRQGISIVHTRSYVPAVIGLALKRLLGLKFVFDMRGFWADERAESSIWPERSRLYRAGKWCEGRFLLDADAVVSLTWAGVAAMKKFDYLQDRQPPFYVIPTCANLDQFHPRDRSGSGDGRFTLGYVGGARLWYEFAPAVECFKLLLELRPNARIVIVNRGEQEYIRQSLERAGLDRADIQIKQSDFAQVAAEVRKMDAAVFFIKPTFSKLASAPTKLGELLGSGVPCLTNSGVGDVEGILAGTVTGIVVKETTPALLAAGIRDLVKLAADPATSARCRAAAMTHFSLDEGAKAYSRIYASLAMRKGSSALTQCED